MTEEAKKETESISAKGLARRRLIEGAVGGLVVGAAVGATAGSLAFPTIPTSKSEPWLPAKWDLTADVVVVGYGGAGAVAAITAHDAGANVLVLEKSPAVPNRVNTYGGKTYPISGGGGNTCLSGGATWFATDADSAAKGLYELSWGSTPMDVCQAFAAVVVNLKSWYDKMNIPYTPTTTPTPSTWYPSLDPTSYAYITMPGAGAQLFSAIDAQVQSRKISVMLGTPATGLIQNPISKEILGVQATDQATGATLNIKARRAVILCTGGFEFDETMKLNYLKCSPFHFWGWQYNTGDGIKMAEKVGAGMWHMTCVSGAMNPWFPNTETTAPLGLQYPNPSSYPAPEGLPSHEFIYVNKHGERYANEEQTVGFTDVWSPYMTDYDVSVPEYTRIPSFIIFDETARKTGALSAAFGANELPAALGAYPSWSSDNSAEVAKGWIQTGATIADLAAAINSASPFVGFAAGSSNNTGPPSSITVNIDPDVLTQTLNTYNSYCTSSPPADLQFGRPASTLVAIQTSPFYAMALWPGGPNTQGGPIRNAKGQVCDSENNPIPRLYSNGELGSIWGLLYHGAGNLSELIVFGQISGANASAETPWD